MPNIKELQSINNELTTNPSVFAPYFSSVGVHNYWSSTSLPNQTTKAWYWNNQFGITTYDLKTNTNYVICVRGNPSLSSTSFSEQTNIAIYPNPASYFANISFPNNLDYFKIEITDLLGKIMYSEEVKSLSNDYKIDLEGYKDGIYFIKVSNEKIQKTFKLFLKK